MGQLDLLCFGLLLVYVQYVLALAAPFSEQVQAGKRGDGTMARECENSSLNLKATRVFFT